MLRVNKEGKSRLQWDKVTDSGNRSSFTSGSVRDTQHNKGRYDLIPSTMLRRLAQHYENGALKYGDNNWQKGQPLYQYYNSAIRHLEAARDADLSEDHLSAAIWNVTAMIHHIDQMLDGNLPIELDSFGIVKAIKDVETFAQIREYYNEPITPASNHYPKRVATRWIPVLSGALSDTGIIDSLFKDDNRARDITRFKQKGTVKHSDINDDALEFEDNRRRDTY